MNQQKNIYPPRRIYAISIYVLLLPAAMCGVFSVIDSHIYAAGLSPVTISAEAKPKKVVFIAGTPSHGQDIHEWEKDAQFLKQSLNLAANIKPLSIDIHYNGWPENSDALDDADAVVFLSDGREHHPLKEPDRLAKIRELARRGVGLAFLHYAVDPPDGAEADFMEWMGGYYERGYSPKPNQHSESLAGEKQPPNISGLPRLCSRGRMVF